MVLSDNIPEAIYLLNLLGFRAIILYRRFFLELGLDISRDGLEGGFWFKVIIVK